MVYETMSAWGSQAFQFNDDIQRRGGIWSGAIPPHSMMARTIMRADYPPPSPSPSSEGAPSFMQAKSQWSPPPSPRTRSLRYDSRPRSHRTSPRSSPRESSPTTPDSPAAPLTPKTPADVRSLASQLYHASCAGDTDHIRLLLALGADVNVPTTVEKLYDAFKPAKPGTLSALAGAAENGQFGAAELLLANGAAINPTMQQSSSSPLLQACKADNAAMATYLLQNGADVNLLNCFNGTSLMYAAKYGSPALMHVLLSYGADVHRHSFIGSAALHWALWPGNEENMELLLQAGADPDQKMGDGSAPLHCAAMSGLAGPAHVLLAYGANQKKKNLEGKTAVQVARELGHEEVVRVLDEADRRMKGAVNQKLWN